jgi:subtilisin family serine protease
MERAMNSTRRFTLDAAPFAGHTGRGVRIAVVDSGIAEGHPHVGSIAGTIVVGGGDPPDPHDRIGHGTAVAAAIREKAADCELLSVKVFHDRLATNVAALASGIVEAATNGARLVNLSLGTANPAHEGALAAAVARAATDGALVVSAREANGVTWLPGSLAGVVGVIAEWEGDRGAIEVRIEGDAITIVASAYPRPIPGVPVERNLSGVSFAVANATGFVARVLEGREGSDAVQVLRRVLG